MDRLAWPPERALSLGLAAALGVSCAASAHLMGAQKGTLNFSGDGAYLVLSVPVSALPGADDDGDGLLSVSELRAHAATITHAVQAGLVLSDEAGARPLEGIMLNLSPKDSIEGHPADQLIVMGRYALRDAKHSLTFQSSLFGKAESERGFSVAVTRNLKEPQALMIDPGHASGRLYASTFRVFSSFLSVGIDHVLRGFDHLLFLLVVVSAGLGFKRLLAALSVFTIGHAVSLLSIVYGGLTLPSRVVEPAIAMTIVALGLYDVLASKRFGAQQSAGRLGVVLVCSLIHGLGLGGALTGLGVDAAHQGVTLLGFNLGIELGQVAVASLAMLVFVGANRLFGEGTVRRLSSLGTLGAVMTGGVWFLARIVAP
jgi:HupE / UreJ protein